MGHTNAWDDAYEAEFTDDNYGYEIDNYLRKLILGVRERMQVDHVWKVSTATDGYHNRLTMPVQTTFPDAVENIGFLYTKDFNGKAELFYLDEDGDEVQLTIDGIIGPIVGISALGVDAIVEMGSNNYPLRIKVFTGTWNMDTVGTKNVAHGLTITDIFAITVFIRSNANDIVIPLDTEGGTQDCGSSHVDATNIVMTKAVGEYFDAAIFNAATYIATIWYKV